MILILETLSKNFCGLKKYKNTYYYDPFVNIKNKFTDIKKLKNFKLVIF